MYLLIKWHCEYNPSNVSKEKKKIIASVSGIPYSGLEIETNHLHFSSSGRGKDFNSPGSGGRRWRQNSTRTKRLYQRWGGGQTYNRTRSVSIVEEWGLSVLMTHCHFPSVPPTKWLLLIKSHFLNTMSFTNVTLLGQCHSLSHAFGHTMSLIRSLWKVRCGLSKTTLWWSKIIRM